MKTTIANIPLCVSASYKGTTTKWGGLHDRYNVVVTYKGHRKSFSFFDSENNLYEKDTKKLNAKELEEALMASLSDASCYDSSQDYNDFCLGFGYDPFEGESKRIYNACKRAYKGWFHLFGSANMWAIYSKLCETYLGI